jgi:hydrogenase maturation factor
VEICDYFGISPYQIATEGSLLLAVDHGQKVLTELAAAGIPAVIIGHLTDDNDRVVLNEEEVRYLEPFR